MKRESVARAYAKSIDQLGTENKINVSDELAKFNALLNQNPKLEMLLFTEVFTVEEKADVLKKVLQKFSCPPIVQHFLMFLLTEKRIDLFPMIYKDVVIMDDDRKGFLRGIIEGNEDDADESLQSKIKEYLKTQISGRIELEFKKNEKITAGYRVTVGDLQLDASLDNQLAQVKQNILK